MADGTRLEPPSSRPAAFRHKVLLDLLESAERVAAVGSWEWLPQSDAGMWSDNMYRLFGFDAGEIVPTQDLIIEHTCPEDRARLIRYFEAIRRMDEPEPIEHRIQHRTLGVRHLRWTVATADSDADGATRIVGVVQDVTSEQVTARDVAAHFAVSTTLARLDQTDDGIVDLLRELGKAWEFGFGALWVPHDHVIMRPAVWSEPVLELGEHEAAASPLAPPLGIALVRRAWRSKRPETLADMGRYEIARHLRAMSKYGLLGAVAFPALHSGQVVAVLEFYHRESAEPIDRLKPAMTAIGYELGEFFHHRLGRLGPQQLTPRQLGVLRLAASGHTTPVIADRLGLSSSTVRTHLDHVFERLGVSDRTAAVATALRLGLID